MTQFKPADVQMRGSLFKVIYHNNENGYLIALFKTGGKTISVVGNMLEPRQGDEYELAGRWTTHAKYGEQFKFESADLIAPTTLHGIEEYLASGLIKGIGPHLASRIVKQFGPKTLDILNNDPDRLLEVEGIGRKKLKDITAAAAAMQDMQEVMSFLKSHNIPTGAAIKIYRTYGKSSIGVVKNNPYQLIQDVTGIGFQIADTIAQKVGVERESMYRLEAGLSYVLNDACRQSGHCYLDREELERRAAELLAVDEGLVSRATTRSIDGSLLASEGDKLFPYALQVAELEAARRLELLMRKTSQPFGDDKLLRSLTVIERRRGITFDKKQREAILHAVQQPVTILTGGPGTGKTLCVNGIIELADEVGLTYSLCAPTGRAAKRLSELTGREARTIHRLLEFDPSTGFFRKDIETQIEADMVIVDEVSMVDVQLFAALLSAVKPESQLVLVGDVDQLPSVGPGQVLRDLIDSKRIPTVRLDTIFRQSGQGTIITNSHRINRGEQPHFSPDFVFMAEDDQTKSQAAIVSLCATILPTNHRYDPFADIQVLSPMHNSPTGVKDLNRELQKALNGHARMCWQGSDRKFLMGDKVMQTMNNYDKDIFNGDIGRVCGVDPEEGLLIVDFYGRQIEYDFEHLDELTLAYAMTIHKSQGNEFKAVVVPMSMSHYIMLQRNLLYTAVTRARELIILVGEKRALAVAINNADVKLRNTMLRQRLIEAL
ncbi:MAG: ATP-dependent RecD-like DNA helicase [Ignavibacteriales bacterium]|nr:ATP-dependent RecD-like DNA helicase [Ignavibacteriales bacterium]